MFKTMKSKLIAGAAVAAAVTTNAAAAITAPTYDVATVETIAGAVIGALALIWVIKQAIRITR